jgi:hypothetical protein
MNKVTLDPPKPQWFLQIQDPETQELLVGLDYKGKAKFGDAYSPDAAVEVFWNALAASIPSTAEKWCEANGYELVKKNAS